MCTPVKTSAILVQLLKVTYGVDFSDSVFPLHCFLFELFNLQKEQLFAEKSSDAKCIKHYRSTLPAVCKIFSWYKKIFKKKLEKTHIPLVFKRSSYPQL